MKVIDDVFEGKHYLSMVIIENIYGNVLGSLVVGYCLEVQGYFKVLGIICNIT